jgi:ornithine cyclodeaminase/alanine dehydrogenase-like protein (mu-crystallin family)
VAPILLDDEALLARLDAGTAVAAMRQAVLDAERGDMSAPPRLSADLGAGRIVFTAGARRGAWFGYRSYDTFGFGDEQVVVLHTWHDGAIHAIAVGSELGARRTGAIGGVAVGALASPGAAHAAVIGTGRQAWTQLWAIGAVKQLARVLVWSRGAAHRAAFAERARRELGLPATEAASAEQAVRDSDIVVLATSSPEPVIDPAWVPAGCHVTSLGPKQQGRSELDAGLAERAAVIVTDSVAQAHAYQPPFVLAGTPHMDRLASLASVLAGGAPGRSGASDITLFCSVGLAGTEVHLLAALTRAAGPRSLPERPLIGVSWPSHGRSRQ